MIMDFKGIYPKVDPTAFIAENAMVIGDVEIGPGTNIWFHSIVRGDLNYIRIGSNCYRFRKDFRGSTASDFIEDDFYQIR